MQTIDELLVATVTPVVPEVQADRYTGDAPEYCTFNYTEDADAIGDDGSGETVYYIQLHYLLPLGRDGYATRRRLRDAVVAAGFTRPTVTNASDDTDQHWVLEFEGVAADG